MENRVGTVLAICIGVGLALAIPRIRRKLLGGLASAAKGVKEGYGSASLRFKKERAAKRKPVRRRKRQPIKLRAVEGGRSGKRGRVAPAPARAVKGGLSTADVSPKMTRDIVRVLKENAQGQALTDLGGKLGVHFVRLAAPMKRLVEQGKVRKEGRLYFATA